MLNRLAAFCLIFSPLTLSATDEPPVTRVTRSATSKFFLRHTPDGTHLLYSSQHANRRASNQILVGARIVNIDGQDDRQLLTPYNAQVQIQEHPAVSPDGTRLLVSGGGNDTGNSSKDVFIADFDKSYQAQNLRKLVPGDGVNLGEEPVWSPDGRQIAFVTIDERLWTVDADGKNKSVIAQAAGQYCHQPEWSPDGQWVVFASDREGNIELLKVRRDGTELTRITDHPGIDCRPRWSRDGQWILFTSNRAGNFDLWVIRPDGSEARQLTTHLAPDDHADWAPDAKSIAFVSMRGGSFDIYRLAVPAELKIGERLKPEAPVLLAAADGLVLHYTFDRETLPAKLALDQTGRHAGELNQAMIVREGTQGRLVFTGEKSFAVCGNGELLRIDGALTLSVWVKPERLIGNHYLISKQGWNIYLAGNGVPQFETRSAANDAWDTLSARGAVSAGEWSHIAAVFDPEAQQMQVYLNGQLSASKPRLDGHLGAVVGSPLELGHYNMSRSQPYVGQMDELKIYRRALSAEEVAREFAGQRDFVTGLGQ